jgi:hypothetical protein
MSYCSVRASHALLIELKYILSEVVVHCLSISQYALVWEWEPRSVPHRAEVRVEVECDLMKRSRILLS